MLKNIIAKVGRKYNIGRPRVVVGVPSGITEVEERAVEESVLQAGAKEVYLIEEPMAAAIGASLDVGEPSGNIIVDIGVRYLTSRGIWRECLPAWSPMMYFSSTKYTG